MLSPSCIERITYTHVFGEEPEDPSLEPLIPVNKNPLPKLFQSWVVTPTANGPFESDSHHVGETCPYDFVVHKLLYHQRFAKGIASANSKFAALVEWIPTCDGAVIRFWRRADFGLFDVAARGQMADQGTWSAKATRTFGHDRTIILVTFPVEFWPIGNTTI